MKRKLLYSITILLIAVFLAVINNDFISPTIKETEAIKIAENDTKVAQWVTAHIYKKQTGSLSLSNTTERNEQLYNKKVVSNDNNWDVTYTTNKGVHPYALEIKINKESGKITSISEEERVIVLFNEKINEDIIEETGGEIISSSVTVPVVSAQIPVEELGTLEKDPNVAHIEDDQMIGISEQKIDWGLNNGRITNALNSSITGKGSKIAIIDTGISRDHSDLVISGGVSFVPYSSDFSDDNGHGTHVAGIIGAKNNNDGFLGVAPDSSLYAVKALDYDGDGYLSDIIAGIDWPITNGMDIINLSIGSEEPSLALKVSVDKAYSRGIFVVASAGNSGPGTPDTVNYPAKYDSALAVGAIDENNQIASFSSTGSALELVAPGTNIASSYLNNSYANMSGTSMAAPFVSGLIALYRELYPNMTLQDIRVMLQQKVIDLGIQGRDPIYGYGFIQYSEGMNNVIRLTGTNRFAVAASVSEHGWPNASSDTVILTNYLAFADALSASPLAFKENAPILLTQRDRIPIETRNQLLRLQAKRVIIIGGTGSVGNGVMNELNNMGITSLRRIDGKDRFEVSANIARELGSASTGVIANGLIFADALSIAPFAAKNGYPILLANKTTIPNSIKNVMIEKNLQNTIVVGGEGSVNNSIFYQLPNPQRIGGKDRYEVSANIAKTLGFNSNIAFVATGLSFADALTGSVLAAKYDAPLLLSQAKELPPSVKSVINTEELTDFIILGGPASIKESINLELKFGL